MIVGMLVDYVGSIGMEPEDEYDEMERFVKKAIPSVAVTFKRELLPEELLTTKVDLYLFDYGAASMCGADGLLRNFTRTLLRVAEEKPNTVILLWSQFTSLRYSDVIKDELGKECGYDVENMPTHFPNIWIMVTREQRASFPGLFSKWMGK